MRERVLIPETGDAAMTTSSFAIGSVRCNRRWLGKDRTSLDISCSPTDSSAMARWPQGSDGLGYEETGKVKTQLSHAAATSQRSPGGC